MRISNIMNAQHESRKASSDPGLVHGEASQVSWSYYDQARFALQFRYRITLGQEWVVEEVVLSSFDVGNT